MNGLRACVTGLAALALAAAAGCFGQPEPDGTLPAASDDTAPRQAPETAPAGVEPDEDHVWLDLRVVDLQGNPLPNMTPIATVRRNAFDEPIARGGLTGLQGHSRLRVPKQSQTFVRAWDPTLTYFANNYFDVLPANHVIDGPLVVTMVRGASVRVRLIDAQGAPVRDEPVAVMMLHPTLGPWWPERGRTNSEGVLELEAVPAGEYGFQFEVAGAGLAELPPVYLEPGGRVNLGAIALEPLSGAGSPRQPRDLPERQHDAEPGS